MKTFAAYMWNGRVCYEVFNGKATTSRDMRHIHKHFLEVELTPNQYDMTIDELAVMYAPKVDEAKPKDEFK